MVVAAEAVAVLPDCSHYHCASDREVAAVRSPWATWVRSAHCCPSAYPSAVPAAVAAMEAAVVLVRVHKADDAAMPGHGCTATSWPSSPVRWDSLAGEQQSRHSAAVAAHYHLSVEETGLH